MCVRVYVCGSARIGHLFYTIRVVFSFNFSSLIWLAVVVIIIFDVAVAVVVILLL